MALEFIGEFLRLTMLSGLTIAGILLIVIWKKDQTAKVTWLRLLVQTVALVGFFYLYTYPLWQLIVLAVILLLPIVLGRFYCGWLCPLGLYMDAITLFRKATKIRHRSLPDRLNKALHNLRYVLLVFFLVVPFVLISLQPLESLNVGVIMATFLAGPFQGYRILVAPTIPFLTPWKGPLIVGPVTFSFPYVQEIMAYVPGDLGSIFAIVFVALTLAGAFAFRRMWCRFCPTGGSIAALNRFRGFKWTPVVRLEKDEEKCTKCGICKRVCPVQVTEVYEQKGGKIRTSMCMICTRCVEMCPYEDTLKVKIGNKTVFRSRNWLGRSENQIIRESE